MICYGGEYVYPNNDGVPSLHTVGVMLGRICRFNGGCREWYPVLGHVLVVAQILDDEAALAGLIHDAPEVCCSDVPTPWKTQVARNREHRLLERMFLGWGLDWPVSDDVLSKVDQADSDVLAAEAFVLGHPRAEEFWTPPAESIMEATRGMLAVCQEFTRPEVAGPLYVEAFEHYRAIRDAEAKRQERNRRARERRAAATA